MSKLMACDLSVCPLAIFKERIHQTRFVLYILFEVLDE